MGSPPNSSRPPQSVTYWKRSGTIFTSTVRSASCSISDFISGMSSDGSARMT